MSRHDLTQILIAVAAVFGGGFLLFVAMRPGRISPTRFTDADQDGEPDVSRHEKQAVIEADRQHQHDLHDREPPVH